MSRKEIEPSIWNKQSGMPNIIYGKNPVLEALEAGQAINKIYLASKPKNPTDKKIIQLTRQHGLPVRQVDRKKLTEIAGHETNPGLCRARCLYPWHIGTAKALVFLKGFKTGDMNQGDTFNATSL